MSIGLPMQFCERDCVAYQMLNEESACDSMVEFVRDLAESVGNFHVIQGIKIFEMFDCKNVATYYFFESDNYAETCTGLLSKQSRGEYIATYYSVSLLCGYFNAESCIVLVQLKQFRDNLQQFSYYVYVHVNLTLSLSLSLSFYLSQCRRNS